MESNQKEVFIYGDIWGGWSLDSLRWQLQEANGKDVLVKINSFGGDVDEGFMMYNELRRYASDNKCTITTFAEGSCASIATVPFLAGDKRIVNEYMQPFIHNAWTYVEGDSKVMKKAYEITEQATKQIAQFYSERTNLTYEEARELMDADTFITAEDCIKYNFAHEIESVPAPVNKIIKPNKLNNMSKPKTSFYNSLKNLFKPAVKNAIIVSVAQDELDFYELEDGANPQVGDKARIGGQPAGEVLTDSETFVMEGETKVKYKFNDEELIEKEVEEEELTTEEMEELLLDSANKVQEQAAEIANLKAELAKYTKVENKFKSEDKQKPSNEKKNTKSDLKEKINKLK